MQWAINQEADVLNASFSTTAGVQDDYLHWLDRAADYMIRTQFVTIVAGAGNMNFGNHLGSPATACGTIAVGAFDDFDSPDWTGDQMRADSAWQNPRVSFLNHGDREKPEVAAIGSNLTTIGIGGVPVNFGRTSAATPQVAGLAALMMDKHDALKTWPTAVKAIIMASAVHDIEPPRIMRHDGFDDRDGAGAIVASLAVEIAAARSSFNGPPCNTPCWWGNWIGDSTFPVETYRWYEIDVSAGDRVRAAIAWHANPSSDYATDPLDTNLNLAVFDPNRQSLAEQGGYSASWNNSYEIVEFDASQTGTYRIGVYKHNADEDSNWLGVAWTRIKPHDAAYLRHRTPGLMLPDQDNQVCFTIRNDGYWEWPAGGDHPVHLGYHWYDAKGVEIPVRVDHRTRLPGNLSQGDSHNVCALVRSPAGLGSYTLTWDLVYEGVAWFADRGDEPLSVPVRIVDTIYPTYLPIILKI